jgi:hypothetical protein
MYSYVRAACTARSMGAQWEVKDLSNILVFDIYSNYSKIILELSNPYLPSNVYVDMDSLKAKYSSYNGTLADLLVEIGNTTLQTVSTFPTTTIKYVRYADAFMAGYKIDKTIVGKQLPAGYPADLLVDLKMNRPDYNTDMKLLHDYCMVSVNGFYHRTDADDNYAYVYDGGTSTLKNKQNHIGILSFLDIGKLTKQPIQEQNILTSYDDTPLSKRCVLWSDTDLTGKSFFLVLGGYMIFPEDNVVWQSGDHLISLNFSAMPLLERYFESNLCLDLSSLGLSQSSVNENMISSEEFFSDAVLKKYLMLSQSFLVIVDTENIFTNKMFIRNSNLPGMFTAYQDPSYPLIVNYGKVAEYWKVKEDGQWSVSVRDSFLRNFVLTYEDIKQLPNVTDQRLPGRTFYNSRGFLLEIGSYK